MKIHLIAIGGAVMHNLALDLKANGHEVTGSDDQIFEPALSRLKEENLLPAYEGWNINSIHPKLDLVILGMHAKADNPELKKAQDLNIPIVSFPEFIAQQSKEKKRIVIAGSHGKTTTTAMVMHCLQFHKMEFDYLVGSILKGFKRMVKLSKAPIIIIEGDEYLSSALDPKPKFLHYKGDLNVITGIAWDHINVFKTYLDYVNQFNHFCESVNQTSEIFAHTSVIEEAYFKPQRNITPYSFFQYIDHTDFSEVIHKDKVYTMNVFGEFNFQNMKAASLVCEKIGISVEQFLQSMESFEGTAKRQEIVYKSEKLILIRDFAHSPSKVKATVKAVRQKYEDRNFVSVLELHTYSSLSEEFIPHYKNALDTCNSSLLFIDQKALEIKNKTIPNLLLLSTVFDKSQISHIPKELEAFLENSYHNKEKTVVLLMSSGNFGGADWMIKN